MRKGPLPLSKNGYTPGSQISERKRARLLTPFARWLKARRLTHYYHGEPIRQKDLAAITGIPYSTITKLERGDMLPTPEDLEIFAQFFRVDVNELWLKCYQIPPDIHLFLCTTVQGMGVMKNIRKIMRSLDEQGGPTRVPEFPEDAPIQNNELEYVHDRIRYFSALDVARFEEQLARVPADELVPRLRPPKRGSG